MAKKIIGKIPPVRGRRRALCARRGVLGAPCGLSSSRGLSLFSSFSVEVFCCVCFGCCGGGCRFSAGAFSLSVVLLCCVVAGVVVVCGGSLSVVALLRGSGVVGSSVAFVGSVSLVGSSFRCAGVAVACVGFSALLLGACRPVSVGVVGRVAGWCVACASSVVLSSVRRAGFLGLAPFLGLALFLCGNPMTKEIKNFRGVKILERRKNSYRYPIPGKTSTRVRPPKASRNFGENCTPPPVRQKSRFEGRSAVATPDATLSADEYKPKSH